MAARCESVLEMVTFCCMGWDWVAGPDKFFKSVCKSDFVGGNCVKYSTILVVVLFIYNYFPRKNIS